jgi:SAM-dependent methyltransferase
VEDFVFEQMEMVEDRHWWFNARRDVIKSFLRKYLPAEKKGRVLEAGCGTGHILSDLGEEWEVFGIDINERALESCRKKGIENVRRSSIMDITFESETFDAVVCSDVLYHEMVSDDEKALKEIYRVCKKGGVLLIFEPAFEWLWSPHDIVEHTRHRYTRKELSAKLKKCGFTVKKSSYHVFLLLPLVLAVRLFKRAFRSENPQSDLYVMAPPVNGFFSGIMNFENKLAQAVNFPWGSTVMCLAVK